LADYTEGCSRRKLQRLKSAFCGIGERPDDQKCRRSGTQATSSLEVCRMERFIGEVRLWKYGLVTRSGTISQAQLVNERDIN